jgi:hypothetical protein
MLAIKSLSVFNKRALSDDRQGITDTFATQIPLSCSSRSPHLGDFLKFVLLDSHCQDDGLGEKRTRGW